MGFTEKQLLAALKTHLKTAEDSRALATDDESRAAVDASIATLTQQIAVLEGGGSLTDLAKVTGAVDSEEYTVSGVLNKPVDVEIDTGDGGVVIGLTREPASFSGVLSGTFGRKSLVIGGIILVVAVAFFLVVRLFGGDFLNGGCTTWSPNTGWVTYEAGDPFCDDD